MEKEGRKHNVMESLLPTKIVRNSSVPSRNVRPKSCEYAELCNEIFGKLPPAERTEDADNDWDELIGHPVCIGGVKQGILRYYGRTKFADGLWCGVELEEPVGKNDGMVNGIRYFYCKPNCGIFAPVTKVSLLPLMSSKRHTVTGGDQNFYRKRESHLLKDVPSSDPSFIKQSPSEPTFQSKQCSRFCSGCPEKSKCTGHRKSYPDQKDTHVLLATDSDCGSWCNSKFSISSKSIESNTLPYNPNNTITLSADFQTLEKHNYVSHSQISRLKGLDRKQPDFMSFPRKVMSEYTLNERENKTMLTSSQTYPYTNRGLKSMEVESYLRTLPGNGKVPPLKHDGHHNMDARAKSVSKVFNPSLEFLDTQDDKDEDQLSLDYDESLGILTPSEMKDFTLCADFPTSYSDTRALDFPSSESFDDVNDLPEDEQVQEPCMQYVSSGPSGYMKPEISCSQQTAMMLHELQHASAHPSHVVTSTDSFLSSISSGNVREVRLTSEYSDYLKNNFSPTQEGIYFGNEQRYPSIGKEEFISLPNTKEKPDQPINAKEFENYFDDNHAESHYQPPLRDPKDGIVLENKQRLKVLPLEQCETESATKKNNDTESSRDSLIPDQEQCVVREKLTVSWEDCVAECTDDMYNKIERPESVYTVGSNDTGYQEDGEFDAGMTTSMESSEDCKRFSLVSRDSCIPVEDLEADKVGESTSTSGYSTGLSDSCCNDRRDDSGRNIMDDSFQDVADACNSDDAQDVIYDGFTTSQTSEKVDGFFDMDSCKDTESASEFHITESSTVLGLDSTSDTICETVITSKNELVAKEHELSRNNESLTADAVKPDAKDKIGSAASSPVKSKSSTIPGNIEKVEPPAKKSPERKPVRNKAPTSVVNNKKPPTVPNSVKDKPDQKKTELKSPKRNVMSKIKAVIGGSSNKPSTKPEKKSENVEQVNKKPVVPKKSRWEAVTSKIAASLAEEKIKPKAKKDVKSRVDTNLSGVRLCRSPKLDSSSASDNKADLSIGSSVSSKSQKGDRQRNLARVRDGKQSSMQVAGIDPDSRNPRPCKTCSSSRSTSPVAASESSTSVSYTSHQSRSKIAVWKGSNSTVASSAPPTQKKKLPDSSTLRSTTATGRFQGRDASKGGIAGKLRSACAKATANNTACPLSPRSTTRSDTLPKTAASRLKNAKEQSGTSRPLVAPRPARPPMWLSKAELTQEIQHLSTLCESRTKELNMLRMESRKVTTGFDALAVVIHYMTSDLKAFKNPQLTADLNELQKKLDGAKEELARYKNEIDKLNLDHAKELNLLSKKLEKEHQDHIESLMAEHEEKMRKLREKQDMELRSLTEALKDSYEEEKLQHAKVVDDLKKELIKQREEMEIFHQHELDDLEERHLEKQKSLMKELEKMQKQCEEAKQVSQNMEDALQKDSDSKMQWITSKRQDLQNEVDSLKAVLEIKNNELHSLRKENLEMQKELEELHVAKEKIKMLQARAEDLQALMNEKVRIERQLSNEHQMMKETYEREAKVNKRLSMENEELLWRLKQVSETSLMTIPISDESDSNVADSNLEVSTPCPLEPSEEEITPSSPAKSPRPSSSSVSRPVFFTYMNEEELSALSPQSPRTQYKRIQPASKSQSPARQFKSPSRPSPRRSRASTDLSPQFRGDTPRKLAKRSNSLRDTCGHHQKSDEKAQNGNGGAAALVVPDSLVSSASSENSVFEPCLLEEHSEHMCTSLEMLEKQRTADFILDVSSLACNSQGEWQIVTASAVDARNEDIDQDYIDPKTYYHMTFPVKEPVQDTDVDEVRKEVKNVKIESLNDVCEDHLPVDE